MSLRDQVEQAIVRTEVEGSAPWMIDETDGDLRLVCELTHAERIACAFTRFEVHNRAWATAPLERVKQVAEQLAKRLTYLLEPIRPIETDVEACIVQLRSNPPKQGEDATSYYELQARRGGVLSLCRFEKPAGEVRRPVEVQVTREVFRQLLADFAAVA